VETPWRRYGIHRVYLRTLDGRQVGWVDLHTGELGDVVPGYEASLAEAARRWVTRWHLTPYGASTAPDQADDTS